MFHVQRPRTATASAFGMLGLIFHVAVRNVRKSQGRNAVTGLLMNMMQTVVMIAVFWVLTTIIGTRTQIRGDPVLFIMSGVFMFMTHTKAIGAVSGSEGPTSPMMLHAPMNTIVSISAAALSSLYTQILSAAVVLYIYHAAFTPLSIHDLTGALGMFMLSWFSGVAIGMIALAATPWWPVGFKLITMIYMRANMITSGKMMVANNTPARVRQWFDWNPLFHTIDQGRGYIFLNYNPHFSTISYPLTVAAACLVVGLMGEYFTRQHVSASWNKT